MIAAEKEKDPDALDEDIITKVNKEVSLKKLGTTIIDNSVALDSRRSKQPAIALGTVIATTNQNEIGGEDQAWKNQVFISKQKTVRVGGPPRGPPPTGGKPGGPPRGPPPTGGKKATQTVAPAKSTGGKATTSTPAAAVNSNIPKAPPVSHFMAYIAGNYDPANPPADSGSAPRPVEDLDFNPDEMKQGDQMGQADADDMADMLDAMGGNIPAVERSSIAIGDDDNGSLA